MQQRTKPNQSHASLPDNLAQSKVHKVYRLQNVLTEDITGTIYGAQTRLKGEEVAVNVLARDCAITSKKLVTLEHPNICKTHKVLKIQDGTIAIIIERPKGLPILEFLGIVGKAAAFPIGQAVSAILQLLSALHAVHLTGMTARNLNVNNIFLYKDANRNLKLKLVSLCIGGSGVNLKAPHYLSPERIMAVDKGDPRADIWAAGAVLYHLCFGRPPFAGDDAMEVAKKNMLEEPDFTTKGRDIPDALIDIIKRAIHRDENKRYQTVSEMVGDLLPLREVYHEPMSTEVKTALKNSYPPPPPGGGLAPKKPSREDKTGLQALHRVKTVERKDPTAEYGTKKKRPDTQTPQRRFFGTAVSEEKESGIAPKKPDKVTGRAMANRTLLGMPAVTTAAIKQAADVRQAKPSRNGEKTGAKKRSQQKDELFSARDMLGSEDEIKKLEEEMNFLDERQDTEEPTLVAGERNLAALVEKVKGMQQAPAEQTTEEPSEPPPPEEDILLETGDIKVVPETGPDLTSDPPTNVIGKISDLEIPRSAPAAEVPPPLAAPSPAARLLPLIKEHKKAAGAVGGAVAGILIIVIIIALVSGGDEAETTTPPAAVPAAPAAVPAATPATASSPPTPPAVAADKPTREPPEPVEAPAPKTPEAAAAPTPQKKPETPPEPETVTINFTNVPEGSEVKLDGKRRALPFEMKKSTALSTVTITCEGYEPFKVRIMPDRNRDVPARMIKAPPKQKKKKSKKKTKNGGSDLVSNPFKK